jgi:hypothetical protein
VSTPPIPADIAGAVTLDLDVLRDVIVEIAHPQHACLWCGRHDCGQPDLHASYHRTSETTRRWTVARANECPACFGDVRQGGPCVVAVVPR